MTQYPLHLKAKIEEMEEKIGINKKQRPRESNPDRINPVRFSKAVQQNNICLTSLKWCLLDSN